VIDLHKVWVVTRHEYLTSIRRAGFIIMTLSLPVLGLIGLLLAAAFMGRGDALASFMERQFDVAGQRTAVVDRSGYFSPILPEYEQEFVLYASEEAAQADLTAEEVDSLLLFEADYLETGEVIVVTPGSSFGAAAISDSAIVRSFLIDHLLADEVDPALRERASDPLRVEVRTLSDEGATEGGGPLGFVSSFVIPYILAIFLVMTIFITSGYLLQSVAEEKESRVVELIVSSIRPVELMAGKVAGLGAAGLTQVVIWVVSIVLLSGGSAALLAVAGAITVPPRMLVLGVIYYLLGFTLYAILMAGAGALGTTMRESQQLAGFFSFFAAVPYMLSGFMFTNPNMVIARVLSFFPLTAPTMMMLRLPLAEVPWIDVGGSIVSLILSIPAALWLGGKLFRVGLLIYDKRPTLREIWRIIRSG
jgi:ABC-2 type transport system permease protein